MFSDCWMVLDLQKTMALVSQAITADADTKTTYLPFSVSTLTVLGLMQALVQLC